MRVLRLDLAQRDERLRVAGDGVEDFPGAGLIAAAETHGATDQGAGRRAGRAEDRAAKEGGGRS